MRRITALILLVVFMLPLWFQDVLRAANQEKQKYSLAVLDLVAPPLSRTDARVVTEQLVRELRTTGLFYTMSQGSTERGLLDTNIDPSHCGDLGCAIRAGRALGVQLVVIGSIQQPASAYSVDIQMVHVGSRQVVKEFQDSNVPDLAGLYETMKVAAREMVGKSGSRPPTVNAQPDSAPQPSPQAEPERYSEPEPYYYEESAGGFKWGYLGVGLLVAGGVGAALLLTDGGSDEGGTSGPPSDSGDLPGPPSFP